MQLKQNKKKTNQNRVEKYDQKKHTLPSQREDISWY